MRLPEQLIPRAMAKQSIARLRAMRIRDQKSIGLQYNIVVTNCAGIAKAD
jgi:hypothetical protein